MSKVKKTFSAPHAARLQELEGVQLASFGARALAFVIDIALVNAIVLAATWAWFALHGESLFGSDDEAQVQIVSIRTWWVLLVLMVYFGLGTYWGKGQTPGKRLLRIRVVSLVHEHLSLWHSIERVLGYAASTLEAGFGFFQYFTHPNAQTVHDRIAETIVIDQPKRPKPHSPQPRASPS